MPPKPPAPSDLADKFMLRMPEGMRDRIAEEAKASGRSMNAEIVHRLQDSLEGGEGARDLEKHIKSLGKAIVAMDAQLALVTSIAEGRVAAPARPKAKEKT